MILSLTCIQLMQLYLLWKLAIFWKYLVFLSPSFNHKYLDFCLQDISATLASCYISILSFNMLFFSDWVCNLPSIACSRMRSSSKALLVMLLILPKISLFQITISFFKSFSFWDSNCFLIQYHYLYLLLQKEVKALPKLMHEIINFIERREDTFPASPTNNVWIYDQSDIWNWN